MPSINLKTRTDEKVESVASIKRWTKATTMDAAVDRLIATDPELADLRRPANAAPGGSGGSGGGGASVAEADPSGATGGADATQVNQTPAKAGAITDATAATGAAA